MVHVLNVSYRYYLVEYFVSAVVFLNEAFKGIDWLTIC